MNIHNEKAALRCKMRQLRQSIGAHVQTAHANTAAAALLAWPHFNNAKHIAIYHAFDGEIPTLPIAQAIWQAGKCCYLPKILPEKKQLQFVPYTQDSKMQPDLFGILEPVCDKHAIIQPQQLDLVLMPLVAFDNLGNRLGMGGGYYDQTFAFAAKNPLQKPWLVGLAHALQAQALLQVDPWDLQLFAVITENGICQFNEEV